MAQTVADFEKQITSSDAQDWKLDSTILHLGTGNCESGIVLSFSLAPKVMIWKECVNKSWDEKTYKWEIVSKKGNQFVLKVGSEEKYEVDFIKMKGENDTKLRLRPVKPGGSTTVVKDLLFVLN